MIKGIRILNFDDSVTTQKRFIGEFDPQVIDLTRLNTKARMWAFHSTVRDISNAISPSRVSMLSFIGSSDYHHVTSILLKKYVHPITVIVFDHRPDWNIFWPKMACNSWVSREVELVNVIHILQFGIGKDAMRHPRKISGNFRSLKGGRLKLYGHYVSPLIQRIVADISTDDVYISLDKSCLRKEENLSNWEEGQMRLDQVLEIITAVGAKKNILGMDVTGEYSEPIYEHVFKKVYADMNRPKQFTAFNKTPGEIEWVNENTNIRIARAVLAK